MITDEEYIKFLKAIISCVSHGDYYSAKELSALELEKMQKKMNEKWIYIKIVKQEQISLVNDFLFNKSIDNRIKWWYTK